jgi:hypothetical protein
MAFNEGISERFRKREESLLEFQVHNRRLSEFRIKRSISKAHRKGRKNPIFCSESAQMGVSSGGGGAQ